MLLRRLIAYALFAVVASSLAYFFVIGLAGSREVLARSCAALEPAIVARSAPSFSLPDLEGAKHDLSSLRGSVVLLHFWATWCPPCLEELPSLFELQRLVVNPKFKLLTVSVDDSPEVVREFFKQNDLPHLPVLIDASQKVPRSYGTEKYPETFLIDEKGVIRYHFVNKRDWSSSTALTCIRSTL